MKNHVAGQAAVAAAAPTTPRAEGLRVAILELVKSSIYLTPAEKTKAAITVAACQSEATLTKWYVNTITELAAREEAAPAEPAAPVTYATASQKEQIIRLLNHPAVTRQQKTKCLLNINRLTTAMADAVIVQLKAQVGHAPARLTDCPASIADRFAAVAFTPAAGLTYAQLLAA